MDEKHRVGIETVYHIGDLDADRERPYISHEGRGLSVSEHPDIWRRIARLDGDTYELHREGAVFYDAVPGGPPREAATDWCVSNGYIENIDAYRVAWTDERGDERTMLFAADDEARARTEAAEEGRSIESVEAFGLGERGVDYWFDAFEQPPAEADLHLVRALIPVWYAEERGHDGVWWDETLAPEDFSAPRGVIFPSALDAWEVEHV